MILNLPMIGLWVRLLSVPYKYLYPTILLFCVIGIYSLQSSVVDVVLAAGFGLLGYVFIKLECEAAPLLLGFVLGPMLEDNFRRALTIARGDPTVFVTRPLSASLLALAAVLLLIVVAPAVQRVRETAFRES